MAQAEDILTAAVAGALDNAQISVSLIPLAAYPFGTPGGYQLLSECMDTETLEKTHVNFASAKSQTVSCIIYCPTTTIILLEKPPS